MLKICHFIEVIADPKNEILVHTARQGCNILQDLDSHSINPNPTFGPWDRRTLSWERKEGLIGSKVNPFQAQFEFSALSRQSFRSGVIRYLAAGALACAAVGVSAPHLLSSDVPLGHDRHGIGIFDESKDKMLEVLKMLLPGSKRVRCWNGPTNA